MFNVRSHLLSALIAIVLLTATSVQAGNIQVANATLVNNDPFNQTVRVQFDLSWEGSWFGGTVNNWDAAWVFVKYRTTGNSAWQHMPLTYYGHYAPDISLDPGLLNPTSGYDPSTNPVLGVFAHRNQPGSGTLVVNGVQLNWNYGGLVTGYANIAEVQVFAIEMVYVPQGAFAAGSGGTESSAFTLTTINTAAANTAPSGTGSLGGQAGGYPTGQTAPVASWPNGFNAFYCMKYEVSQQGYVDFLNTLTYTQQVTRTATAPNSTAGTGALSSTNANRNGIDLQTPGVASATPAVYACNLNGNTTYGEAADGKDIACNWLNWGDLTAYLDWSGLRPMTELEFEKACRGPLPPVANEYPWGTTGIAGSAYTLANAGATNEGIATDYSTIFGNAICQVTEGTIDGPVRVGIFAANSTSSGRITAGASYYGIMELGGNVYERPVTIGNANGRTYTGTHGNGTLTASGDPDGVSWPAPTTADGAGLRGAAWSTPSELLRVSNRFYSTQSNSARQNNIGSRGVRQAP